MAIKYSIGIFGIIFDDQQRVLLCHRRDHDLWNLPGGGLEPGESVADGMIREVKEETGLDVKILHLLGVYSKAYKEEVVFSFLCQPMGGQITLNDEADKIEYFAVEKLPSNISPNQVERIHEALAYNGVISFNVQKNKPSVEFIKENKL